MEGSLWLSSQPKKQKEVLLGILGVGEAGTNMIKLLAKLLDPEEYSHLRLCAANTDGPKLYSSFLDEHVEENVKRWLSHSNDERRAKKEDLPPQLWVIQLGDWGTGAGGDPELGKKGAEMQHDAIKEFLDGVDVVIIVTGLGGGTGTGATPVIARMAKEQAKFPIVVATMPFGFEGKRKIDRAAIAHAELLEMVPTITVYNDRLPDKKITYDKAWEKANEGGLLPPLNFLLRLLTEVGKNLNRDLADYGALLNTGNNILCIGIDDVDEEQSSDAIVSKLLEGNPYQDSKIVEDAESIIPAFNGPWNVDETQQISKSIEDRVRVSGKSLGITFFVGDIVGKKSVSMLIAAKKSPTVLEMKSVPSILEATIEHARPELVLQSSNSFELETEIDDGSWVEITITQAFSDTATRKVRVPSHIAERWQRLQKRNVQGYRYGNGNGSSYAAETEEFDSLKTEILKYANVAPSHMPPALAN